jgi:hypothetical protein
MQRRSTEVVSALKSSGLDESIFGHLIEELKFRATLNFANFECVHVSRVCNVAAHELASLGYLC